jgi:glycosyltransferase involved in cell wall biosynthesis
MTADPRVVFGMPAYNRPDTLGRTFESLLSQTFGDFAIVIVDDRPSPEVETIVDTYSAICPRITYEPNPVRLGMIANWRKAFERSREIYPGSVYFAWVSDHDIWHPRWLEVLVRELDKHPEVVVAYPLIQRVFPNERRAVIRVSDTIGVKKPARRLRAAATEITAGNCIYGLFRASALARAGVFRPVLMPDREILVQLSLLGEFKHVPEILWYREVAGAFSFRRQREMFFPGRVPLHTYLPPNVQHCGSLIWNLAIHGRGRPAIGRFAGIRYAALQLWFSTKRELLRDEAWWMVALGRTALGRWLESRRSARARSDRAAALATERRVST